MLRNKKIFDWKFNKDNNRKMNIIEKIWNNIIFIKKSDYYF